MKHHLEILKKIKTDIMSEDPQFIYPENPRKRVVKDSVKDEVRKLDMAVGPLRKKVDALNDELDARLEQTSPPTTPRTPTRAASPLMFLAFKRTPTQTETASVTSEAELIGADLIHEIALDQIKDKIAKINSQIDEMFTQSQEAIFQRNPEIKPIYALIFADSILLDNHHKGATIDNFLIGKQDEQEFNHLRELRAQMQGIENELSDLRKNPNQNVELIFSKTHQYSQLIVEQNNEWAKIRKKFVTGVQTTPPSDPEQKRGGTISPRK